jgi:undecaprenyl-diphosphatase
LRLGLALLAIVLFGWALGELVRATMQSADLTAVRGLAGERTGTLTRFARAFSLIGSGSVVFPLALVFTLALWVAGRRRAAAVVGLATMGAIAIINVDKVLVDRPRPPVHHLQSVGSASFPSGHASQATAVFGALALVFLATRRGRGTKLVTVTAAVLLVGGVAWSRIYLGVHYPSDVAAGILLAGMWIAVSGVALHKSRHHRRRGLTTRSDGESPGPAAAGWVTAGRAGEEETMRDRP